MISEISICCEECGQKSVRLHVNNDGLYMKCDSCGHIETLPQMNISKKEDNNMIFNKWSDLKKEIKCGNMQEVIESAKESMTESKRIVRDRILGGIRDAKKEGYLYFKYPVKRTEIDLKQADEVMEYLVSIGYDVYKNIPNIDMATYASYTIFWDDKSSGKYRNEDVKWFKREVK